MIRISDTPERQDTMKFELPWKSKKITLEKDLGVLEKHLASTLKPVEPNPEFLKNLRSQLVGEPERKKFQLKLNGWRQGLLVAGGIVSFFAMVIGGIRVVASLLDKQSRRPVVEEPISA